MKQRFAETVSLLMLMLLGVCLLAASAGAVDEADEEEARPAPHFTRIGVYEFDNITKRRNAGKEFSRILCDRLAAKFGDVEFVYITPDESGYPEGPVLLKHAQRIGEKYGVEAIIDGTFLGYKVTGGIWPSRATPSPEVMVQLKMRVVETAEGTVFAYYSHIPKKPRVYPSRIRTEKQLWNYAIRDVIDEEAKRMDEDGLFFEEKEEGEED